jgi:hypothetical protein
MERRASRPSAGIGLKPSLGNSGDGFLKAKGQSFPRPKRILLVDLEATRASFSDEIKRDENRIKWELVKTVFGHYLGHDWVTKYFSPDFRSPKLEDYFRLDFSLGVERQQEKIRENYGFLRNACESSIYRRIR